jgi:hypothetical protein
MGLTFSSEGIAIAASNPVEPSEAAGLAGLPLFEGITKLGCAG